MVVVVEEVLDLNYRVQAKFHHMSRGVQIQKLIG